MHPYMTIIYPDKFRQQVDGVIKGAAAPKTFDKTGTQRSHRLWPKYLRYCPDCVREDIDIYGETYWHRIHQLPAMLYCTKHHVRLYDSDIEVIGSRMDFHPASAELLSECHKADENDSFLLYKKQFIRIGLESEWLLRHGVNIDWDFDLHAKYKRFFRDKGIATVQGVSNYDLIADAFEEYWGRGFLDCLRSELSDNREWIRQIYEARMISFKPIYHILLMCFLCGSVSAFLGDAPKCNIFGNSPWACINALCDHYGVDGVENVDIRYLNGVATGFFKCNICGMVYKQRYWRARLGKRHIVEYGDIWIDKMIRCLRDENLDIPKTAEILKCKPHVVRWQMRKLGILGNSEYLKKSRKHDSKIGAEAYYKVQVLELCEQYDEVTSDILKQYAPNAYKYLYKFDLGWLHEYMTFSIDSKRQRDEDAEMLRRVQNAADWIKANGDKNKRLTVGYIADVAEVKYHELIYSKAKRPLTKTFLDSIVENKKDWLRRRISAIRQNKSEHETISTADIKLEMSLKPNTFVKYGQFLKELIDELNE
jgi:hypothetical protein